MIHRWEWGCLLLFLAVMLTTKLWRFIATFTSLCILQLGLGLRRRERTCVIVLVILVELVQGGGLGGWLRESWTAYFVSRERFAVLSVSMVITLLRHLSSRRRPSWPQTSSLSHNHWRVGYLMADGTAAATRSAGGTTACWQTATLGSLPASARFTGSVTIPTALPPTTRAWRPLVVITICLLCRIREMWSKDVLLWLSHEWIRSTAIGWKIAWSDVLITSRIQSCTIRVLSEPLPLKGLIQSD